MRRPSASVLVMSTFLPLSAVTMSPGRVECGRHGQQGRARRQTRHGLDGGDDRARTGLVHLHLFHPVGWLDRDAAGVEAHALADDGQVAIEPVALPFPA